MVNKEDTGPERSQQGRHFAPYDLTDGREPYDWPTKWEGKAQFYIALEAVLLFVAVLAVPFLMVFAWNGSGADLLGIAESDAPTFNLYALAWLGGLLGGASFSLKWLYHSVAKGSWHRDRLIWRFATPLLSAGLAFSVVALVRSGLLPLIDGNDLQAPAAIVAFAFVTGYFSDHAIAALLRLAQRVFGETRQKVEEEEAPNKDTH